MPAVLILIPLLLPALAQPGLSKDAFDLKELHRLEEVWNTAHVKGDAATLDELWADDLIVTIAAMPVMKKTDALAMVRSNRMRVPDNRGESYGSPLSCHLFVRHRGRAGALHPH